GPQPCAQGPSGRADRPRAHAARHPPPWAPADRGSPADPAPPTSLCDPADSCASVDPSPAILPAPLRRGGERPALTCPVAVACSARAGAAHVVLQSTYHYTPSMPIIVTC